MFLLLDPYILDINDCYSPNYLSDAWDFALQSTDSWQVKSTRKLCMTDMLKRWGIGKETEYMLHEATGTARKLAYPYFGPHQILSITPTNAEVRLIDKPYDQSMFVSPN